MKLTRRESLCAIGTTTLCTTMGYSSLREDVEQSRQLHVATNTYPWRTFAKRSGTQYARHTDQLLGRIASTGIAGYEPIVDHVEEFDGLSDRLKKHKLELRSIYVNSVLHDGAQVDQSIENAVAIAKAARQLGARIVVTNPSPIRWGGTEDKTDAQLRLQAKSLDQLGAEMTRLGITLAYHNHDAELRQGGREFHHMLTATDPDHVSLCLDAHWIFRGCGDSQVALFDALAHYHQRIVELHLRQSKEGAWTEAFTMQGDIDYQRLFAFLTEKQITPHLVLEQAVEAASPHTMSVVDAHKRGNRNLRRAFPN